MTKLGRNHQCSCGSGKKYKLCCLPKHEAEAAQRSPAPRAATTKAKRLTFQEAARESIKSALLLDEVDDLDQASNCVVDLVRDGKLDEAEKAARDLLTRYPDVHDGFERLAMVYEARGDRERAADYYRQALTFMSEHADSYDSEAIDWMRKKADSMGQAP